MDDDSVATIKLPFFLSLFCSGVSICLLKQHFSSSAQLCSLRCRLPHYPSYKVITAYSLCGTHRAGTAGGFSVGVAPEANIYGVKILNDSGCGYISVVLGGMEFLLSIRENGTSLLMVVFMRM